MKTAIIYATKNGSTEKVANALSEKIKGEVKLIPVKDAVSECLLKYDFVVFAGSIYFGHIQKELKSFVNQNAKTIMGMNYGFYVMCIYEENQYKYFTKAFGNEIVDGALITGCFGGEVDPEQGSIVTKRIIKANLQSLEEKGKEPPSIKWDRVDDFAKLVNEKILI